MTDTSRTDTQTLPVVILISGHGTNMEVLAKRAQEGTLPIDVRAVITDRPEAAGLERAHQLGITTASRRLRDFPSRAAFDEQLADLVESFAPKLVVLAGYMKILSDVFVRRFSGRLLNIHPSLLPKYPGLHTHRRALEASDSLHGASVHFVTEALDSGPVIIQGRVIVNSDDTESSLAARVHQAEHIIYSQAVDLFARGRVELRNGRVWLDAQELQSPIVIEVPQ